MEFQENTLGHTEQAPGGQHLETADCLIWRRVSLLHLDQKEKNPVAVSIISWTTFDK